MQRVGARRARKARIKFMRRRRRRRRMVQAGSVEVVAATRAGMRRAA